MKVRGRYTRAIVYTKRLIEQIYGLKVILFARKSVPENVSGRIHYKKRTIELNEPSAKCALMTLCHEIGHWLSYQRYKDKDPTYKQREIWAYLFGWGFARKYRLDCFFTKEDWKEYHNDINSTQEVEYVCSRKNAIQRLNRPDCAS